MPAYFTIKNTDAEYSLLNEWRGLKDKNGILDSSELIERFDLLPYRFEDMVTLDIFMAQTHD